MAGPRDEIAQRLDHAITFAKDCLRGLLFINGGAVVALLTLVGSVTANATSVLKVDLGRLELGLGLFVAGTFLAVAANIAAYLSQDWFFMGMDRRHFAQASAEAGQVVVPDWDRAEKAGEIARWMGIAAGVLSLLAFGAGAATSMTGFRQASSTASALVAHPPPPSRPAQS